MSDIVKFSWGSDTESTLSVEAAKFNSSQRLTIKSDENLTLYDRELSLSVGNEEYGVSGSISILQEKPLLFYSPSLVLSNPDVLSSPDTFSAAGGRTEVRLHVVAKKRGTSVVIAEEDVPYTVVFLDFKGEVPWAHFEDDILVVDSRADVIGDERKVVMALKWTFSDGFSSTWTATRYQEANARTVTGTTGGVTTYGAVTAGAISNKTIMASGGEATATAGDGSQPWEKSAVITTYTYSSGATRSEETTGSSAGVLTISPSVSSKTASAGSKGTVVSGVTTVASQAVIWSGQGNKSASGTMYIYQAANEASYGAVTISGGTGADIPASGGSVSSLSGLSAAQSVSYSSGSTRAVSPTITYSAAVSANSLSTTLKARTKVGALIVTATGEGGKSSSKSVDIYQALNKVVDVHATNNTLYYSNLAAAGGTVEANGWNSVAFVWSSGAEGDPDGWTNTKSYAMATGNGFTINTTTGAVTAPSRGTTVGPVRTSNTITRSVVWSYTNPASVGGGTVSKTFTATATVSQNANAATSIDYGTPSVTLTYGTAGAGASTASPAVTYSQSRTQHYTSGSTSALSALTSGGSLSYAGANAITGASINTTTGVVAAPSRGTTVGGVRTVLRSTVTVSLNGKSGSSTVDVKQAANSKTQTGITIFKKQPNSTWQPTTTWDSLPASACAVGIGGVYNYAFTSGSTSTEAISRESLSTSEIVSSVAWAAAYVNIDSGLKVATRGTDIGPSRSGTVYIKLGGFTSNSLSFTQQLNRVVSLSTTFVGSYKGTIPAAGGTKSPGWVGDRVYHYSSGSTGTTVLAGSTLSAVYSMVAAPGFSINPTTAVVTATNNTSLSARTSGAISCRSEYTYTNPASVGGDKVTLIESYSVGTVSQAAGYYSYSAWSVSASANPTTIGAGGGTSTITGSATRTYGWNGATSGAGTQTGTVAYSISTTSGATLSSNKLTWASRGTTVGNERSVVVRVTCQEDKSKTATVTVKQGANAATTITYGVPSVSVSAADVPASGGSVTSGTVAYSQSRTQNYTSGSTSALSAVTSGGTVTWSGGASNVASLGTTVKARTAVGSALTARVSLNGQSGSGSVTVYQAANAVTNSNYNPRITARGVPTVSIGSGITAGGGSATVTASVNDTQIYNAMYTSGSTGPNQTRSVAGSVSLSLTGNGNSRFSLSGNRLSHSSMTTNVTTDTGTVTATNANDSTKKATASVRVENKRSVTGTTGGVYTYYGVTAGAITNQTVPASGGTKTATAGNGSQRVTRTAIVTSYSYTSGSSNSATTTAASDVTNQIAPSVASKSGTASSKGTTVSGVTTIVSQAVTWTGQGSKSASGTMYVYQAENKITAHGSWADTFTLSRTSVSEDADYVVYSGSSTRTNTYSSGSTARETSAIKSVASNQTWTTISGSTISFTANSSSSSRSATLTATYNNNRTKTATLTQSGMSGNIYIKFHNNYTQSINWQVACTITLDRNYTSANVYSSYYTTSYGGESVSTEPCGILTPLDNGQTTCSEMKLTNFTVQATNTNGSYVGRQFKVWVEVQKSNVSSGQSPQLATCGSQYSPMISNGTSNSSPISSSNVRNSSTFYTSEVGMYIIHVLLV